MDRRRERERYDRHDNDTYYSGGAGYSRDDEHYHSARNLTNEFEQHYREHRGDRDDDRSYSRDRYRPQRSFHEGGMESDYEQRGRRDRDYRGESDYQRRDWDNDRNQRQGYSSHYGSGSDRYNRYQDDFKREHDSYNRDRNRGRERRGSMNEDRMQEGYGISDYDSMRGSSMHSDRGIPNSARRNYRNEEDSDLGGTFDGRSYGLSSGYYGAYGGRGRRDD